MIDTSVASYGMSCWYQQPSPMAQLHRHNDIELNYVEHGAITYLFGGTRLTVRAGDLLIFWAARPHQLVHCDERSHMYGLTLPLPQFLRWALPTALHTHILGGVPLLREQPGSFLDHTAFERWIGDLQLPSPADEAIVLLELEAGLRRLGRATTPAHSTTSPHAPTISASKVEQMARFIAEHHTEPLRAEQIAEVVAVHPSYAMALFRQTMGVSFITYLTQHRIAHAQQLLVLTDQNVVEIGMEVGFASPSRFYRAFKSICGTSPHQYRMDVCGQRSTRR